jgi:glycosyltransferase involved in cell wall biosynthesis
MHVNDLPQSSQNHARGSVCVVVAGADGDERVERCLESVRRHTAADVQTLRVPASATAVNRALANVAPADVVVLTGCAGVSDGWLERLRRAGRADTNTATASALSDVGGPLALKRGAGGAGAGRTDGIDARAAELAAHTQALRPRLSRAVGPCVYVRREAVELVGMLDEELDLPAAVEIDFAQRCLLAGLSHVAADDVVVEHLEDPVAPFSASASPTLLARYPYLAESTQLGESALLEQALAAVRGPDQPLPVTLDARSLGATITGTQVNILELIGALARTGELALRVLVRTQQIAPDTLERLRSLAGVELLAESELSASTPPTRVFHRPQQAFAAEDVALGASLGERIVLSQLDLIAYRNPGYFPDAASWQDYRRASRHGLAAAERVIVFSEHTRAELLDDGLVEGERIRVVPPGLDHRAPAQARRPESLDAAERAGTAEGFLLCLGTDFRHKNRIFALRLLAALRDEHGWSGSLILAGTHIPNGSSHELEGEFLAARPDLDEAIITLGGVDESEKAWLMAHAGAVVYPSTYEGFGMVPFESALAGVPCLFAAQSSLAEVAPPGTTSIVQWDVTQSAAAAYALLSDERLRAEHVAALAAAATELTWDRAAAAMVQAYREAAVAPAREAGTLARDAVAREARLTAAHQIVVERLIGERRHAQRMYDDLNAEVGAGLSLIGPNGTLPENLQRALLSVSAHRRLARPLFGAVAGVFAAMRAIGRALAALRGPGR